MFERITDPLRAIHSDLANMSRSLQALAEAPQEASGLESLIDRIEGMERTLEARLAEAEAAHIRADGRFAAARASEERARGKEQRAEQLTEALQSTDPSAQLDPFEEAGLRYGGDVPAENGDGIEPLPPMSQVLGDQPETLAALKASKRR